MDLFFFNVLPLFLPLFILLIVLSISSSSSFDRQYKLEGGKRFLSMSTCRTLTLGCSFPMVNRPSKKFTVSALYKRVLLRTCCWSTVEMHLICSWRTRSNSQTGLGAEELLPAEFAFCSCCFFFFFPLLSSFLSSFFLFPFFCFRAVFFFRLISSQMKMSVTQSSSPSPPT